MAHANSGGFFMNIIKTINSIVLFALCTTISNNINAIARYKARPLETLAYETLNTGEVGFRYKLFNKQDCQKYLGRKKIISKKYTPIQMSITNNTNKSFQFSLNNFSLPCVSYNQVAHDVHFSPLRRFFGWFATWTFVMIPICLLVTAASILTHTNFSRGGGSLPVTWRTIVRFSLPPLITAIPPIIAAQEKSRAPKAQKQLLIDYESKSLHDTAIKPFETVNGIIFVRTQELKHDFSVTLIDTSIHKKYTLSTDVQRVNVLQENSLLSLFNGSHQIFWNKNASLYKG
jgi:hypothetical protein